MARDQGWRTSSLETRSVSVEVDIVVINTEWSEGSTRQLDGLLPATYMPRFTRTNDTWPDSADTGLVQVLRIERLIKMKWPNGGQVYLDG